MDLPTLIAGFGVAPMDAQVSRALQTIRITHITEDSRHVIPGSLFIARAGTREDGAKYIASAIQAGAAAVLCDHELPATKLGSAVGLRVSDANTLPATAAKLAERFHGSPSSALAMIGVTGTKGKTTTTHLIEQLLNQAGSRCGLIGTINVKDGRSTTKAGWTTPPATELSRILASMVSNGCRACAMEVSSHALDQSRVAAIRFRVGVFTNLTGDHLDYHRTMEEYATAKARLFRMLPSVDDGGVAIVNAMDPAHERMIDGCRSRILRCRIVAELDRGQTPPNACLAAAAPGVMNGTPVEFAGPWGRVSLHLPLAGRHNVMNALQAFASAWATGLVSDPAILAQELARVSAPSGRLEIVSDQQDPFLVLVDYAHTDDALRNALPTVRPLVASAKNARSPGKLIVVFGCGGDRDRTKRARMGLAAVELADSVWITSDNPRTENPASIIDEIITGIPGPSRTKVMIEPDRRTAIERAVASLHPGDALIIAGKGHEQEQILADGAGGTRTIAFSDQAIAREALHARRLALIGGAA